MPRKLEETPPPVPITGGQHKTGVVRLVLRSGNVAEENTYRNGKSLVRVLLLKELEITEKKDWHCAQRARNWKWHKRVIQMIDQGTGRRWDGISGKPRDVPMGTMQHSIAFFDRDVPMQHYGSTA
jgi:hypothetical protein